MKPKNTEGGERCTAVECTVGERTATGQTATERTDTNRTAADRRKKRRKSAIQGAVVTTLMHLVAVGILLWVRAGHDPASFLAKFTLVLAGFELISVVPVWVSLKERFKEIEGGEEDAAAQY